MRAGAHPFPGHEPGGTDFAPGGGRGTARHCRRGRRRGSDDDPYSTARHLPWAPRPGRRAVCTWRHRGEHYGGARPDYCAASRRGELPGVHLRPGGEPRGCGNGAAHRPSPAALRYPPRVSGDGSACRREAVRLNPQDLGKNADLTRWNTTTGVPKISGKARAITTSARTSKGCRDISRVTRRSRYSILAAGRDATSRRSPKLGHIAVGLEGAARLAVMARAR